MRATLFVAALFVMLNTRPPPTPGRNPIMAAGGMVARTMMIMTSPFRRIMAHTNVLRVMKVTERFRRL